MQLQHPAVLRPGARTERSPHRRHRPIHHKQAVVGKAGLGPLVHAEEPVPGVRVVLQVLHPEAGVPGADKELVLGPVRSVPVGPVLPQRPLVGPQHRRVVLQEHLVVVVVSAGVRVDAVGHHKLPRAAGIARGGAEGDAVDPAAAVPVRQVPSVIGPDDRREIVDDLLQVHGGDHPVGFRIHSPAGHPVHLEDGHIEGRRRLVLEGGVDPAVVRVEGHVAQMAREPRDRTDDGAGQVGFHQQGGEGEVDETLVLVHGDALDVPGAPHPAVDARREVPPGWRGRRRRRGGGRRSGRGGQDKIHQRSPRGAGWVFPPRRRCGAGTFRVPGRGQPGRTAARPGVEQHASFGLQADRCGVTARPWPACGARPSAAPAPARASAAGGNRRG